MTGLPAGTSPDPPGAEGVHAIDGDGSSLCGLVDADRVARVDSLNWPDVPRGQRCNRCQILMTSYGMGHL